MYYYYNGTSWTSISIGQPASIGDADYGFSFVACDASGGTMTDPAGETVSKYIYAGAFSTTAGSGGVYASSNGGGTWTKITLATVVDKPYHGEVASNGTLYVTFDGTSPATAASSRRPAEAPPSRPSPRAATRSTRPGGGSQRRRDAHGRLSMPAHDSSGGSTNGGTTGPSDLHLHGTEPDGTPSVTDTGT